MIKKILIFYKQSTYKHFFLNGKRSLPVHEADKAVATRFIDTHLAHYQTLQMVEGFIKSEGLPYSKMVRGLNKDFSAYDVIITVGGDGTFLEGSSAVKDQIVLGINSDPKWSVGRFCSANSRTFKSFIRDIVAGSAKIRLLNRMKIILKKSKQSAVCLNDVLVCHRNPGAMSRYFLNFRGIKEEQRSSGVWVATAAGSTGAIRSAGGKILPESSKNLQFVVRELYRGKYGKSRYRTAIFKPKEKFQLKSLMRDGVIYIDGSHIHLPFAFGEEVAFQNADHPLRMVVK